MKTTLFTSTILSLMLFSASVLAEAPDAKPVLPEYPTMGAYYDQFGKTVLLIVTGGPGTPTPLGNNVWGTDLYALGSQLAPAAVHAGALKDGETGVVKVTIVKGDAKTVLPATTRNGIKSQPWTGAEEGTFRIEKSNVPVPK